MNFRFIFARPALTNAKNRQNTNAGQGNEKYLFKRVIESFQNTYGLATHPNPPKSQEKDSGTRVDGTNRSWLRLKLRGQLVWEWNIDFDTLDTQGWVRYWIDYGDRNDKYIIDEVEFGPGLEIDNIDFNVNFSWIDENLKKEHLEVDQGWWEHDSYFYTNPALQVEPETTPIVEDPPSFFDSIPDPETTPTVEPREEAEIFVPKQPTAAPRATPATEPAPDLEFDQLDLSFPPYVHDDIPTFEKSPDYFTVNKELMVGRPKDGEMPKDRTFVKLWTLKVNLDSIYLKFILVQQSPNPILALDNYTIEEWT